MDRTMDFFIEQPPSPKRECDYHRSCASREDIEWFFHTSVVALYL